MPTLPKLGKKIAVVAARGLGDGLIAMVISNNLLRANFQVTTFSTALTALKAWFPAHAISPFPLPSEFEKQFSSFDNILSADHAILADSSLFKEKLHIFKESSLNKQMTLVDNFQILAEKMTGQIATKEIGICPPFSLFHRNEKKRVAIHPMSLEEKRTWPAEKFICLFDKLQKKGYEPFFCVSPQEHAFWKDSCDKATVPYFPSLQDTAQFIYESNYFIGNNSGLGHLASSLGIPSLSLFARNSYAQLWRPGWALNHVVTPFPLLPGSRLKQKYWKHLLSPTRVLHHFFHLVQSDRDFF